MTNDAVKCEKCGGELETSLVWDKCRLELLSVGGDDA